MQPEVKKAGRTKALLVHFLSYKWWFLGGAISLLVTNGLGLMIPSYIGQAIDTLRTNSNPEETLSILVSFGKTIILLAVVGGIARVFSRIFIFNAARSIEFDIRNALFGKLATLGPRFFSSMSTGDITSRVTNDVTYVRLLFAIAFLHIINTSFAYIIALNKMIHLNLRLTIYVLLTYPILLLIVRRIVLALHQQVIVVQSHLSLLSTKIQENLSGIAVVQTYAIQDRESADFAELNDAFVGKNLKLALIRGGIGTTMILLGSMGTAIVLIFGSADVASGQVPLGEFVEFNAYVVALAFPTMAMGWVFSVWKRGVASFDRVDDILKRVPEILESPSPKSLPSSLEKRGAIRFEKVCFSYEQGNEKKDRNVTPHEGKEVLHTLDFEIPAGSTVAFVGRTGSGKTSIANLISRLYDPSSGRIFIDDLPLNELRLREARSEIGMVPQDPFLFSMTIGENVRFGLDSLEHDAGLLRDAPTHSLIDDRTDLSQDERIDQALEIAGLNFDIDTFPDGKDTIVGERGVTLSGGQKQRVTIARALLVDPRILILDDALSSIDTQTEKIILDHLDKIMENRTSIIITHRFNALSRVDKIFVIDEGKIVQEGIHADLILEDGVYRELWEHQQLSEELNK